VAEEERRCPSCGALATADAEWCGQCFASLREPEPEPEPALPPPPERDVTRLAEDARATADGLAALAREPFWPCTACGAKNAIYLEVCETCGTPFAAVMRGTTRRDVDPDTAVRRSLVFPGAGHTMLGYGIDGFARGVLFVLSLGIALFLWVAAPHVGAIVLACVISLGMAIGVYALSAVETRQVAEGGQLIVPSQYLLWVAVGAMFLVVAAIALTVATSARR
jgi:hypothetical protein